MLVDWFSELGVRISSDRFMEWTNEDNLTEFLCAIFTSPIRIQDSQSPSGVQLVPLQQTEDVGGNFSWLTP